MFSTILQVLLNASIFCTRSRFRNMAMKIDIRKAFDTIQSDFLLSVLKGFRFSSFFCQWIRVILHSAYILILFNGSAKSYFHCEKGVRKGIDPLSLLLFCL